MYRLLRPLLFLLTPERAHRITFFLLDRIAGLPFLLRILGARRPSSASAVSIMGMHFPSPVGLAAGMDKDALHVNGIAALGFGHIEVGTLTPRPQPGNPKPRLFRLRKDRALINRMGFNNGGAAAAVERLGGREVGIIVGGNIGRNKDTPNERAIHDYETCLRALHPVVDYFVVNVSSPNTPGLRELQEKASLLRMIERLRIVARELGGDGMKPMLIKIAPDLSREQLDDVVEVVKASGVAGVVATNTTISREGLVTPAGVVEALGTGGLSGAPLRARSTEMIRELRIRLPRPFVIIGVGGINSAEAAIEKFEAGADLVQVYTGLIYEGPALVRRINEAYARWKR